MTDAETNLLREYLTNADVPYPGCGYNLRGLPGAQCPECGDEIKLQIGLAEPRLAANIAGLIGLAAGGGFNGLLLIYIFIERVFLSAFIGSDLTFLRINVGGFCVEGFALFLWLRYWRHIRRQPSEQRWLLVGSCWLLTLANIVVFTVC